MKRKSHLVIAIDGHSSCGKSTFAKAIAASLGYIYIDSGAMYRAVTWDALEQGILKNQHLDLNALLSRLPYLKITIKKEEQTGSFRTLLNGRDIEDEIRSLKVSDHVSEISAIKEVREYMVRQQRSLAGDRGVVMDGRDIGTVVFPQADIKIFMTATAEIRARRRFDELQEKGVNVAFDEVLENIQERDRMDSSRTVSPLKMAPDAWLLDNSHMTVEDQLVWFKQVLEKEGNISG